MSEFQNQNVRVPPGQLILRETGGAMRDRTADLLRARQALSQLSYSPITCLFRRLLRCVGHSLSHIPQGMLLRSFLHAPGNQQKILRYRNGQPRIIVPNKSFLSSILFLGKALDCEVCCKHMSNQITQHKSKIGGSGQS